MENKFILLLIFVGILNIVKNCVSDNHNDQEWQMYKKRHRKLYRNKTDSERCKNWKHVKDEVEKHNKLFARGLVSYNRSVNTFSDWTKDELEKYNAVNEALLQNVTIEKRIISKRIYRRATIPASFSWVDKGAVTDVKDQGHCGACWAFASTGALEGAYFLANGLLVSISEQQLMDCNYNNGSGNWGCKGGWYYNAVKYWYKNGFQNESSYPYQANVQTCSSQSSDYYKDVKVRGICTDYGSSNNETILRAALFYFGPVAVSMRVVDSFYSYKSGIYSNSTCNDGEVNHSVLIVGYGTENGADYWLVKNSWGTGWGMNGFFKIARNANNMCWIAKYPCFVILS